MRSETIRRIYEGRVINLRIDRTVYDDGGESEREVVEHPGAVAIVAYDDVHVHLIRQPREAIDEPAMLEVPAGKLDVAGESRIACAQRELVEEIGMTASQWTELRTIYPSPGFCKETVTIFTASGLDRVADHRPDPDERIEVVPWPLHRLNYAIDEIVDAKSLIGLLLFRASLD